MITGYAGHEMICGNCGANRRDLGFAKSGFTVLWANQHGEACRLFCYECCHSTDYSTHKEVVVKPFRALNDKGCR